MYSTCLFCNNSLGANEVIETFPVGRRLAFDQRHGRLWVVCRKCEKWNLTPLEERWEAIENCEQLFRGTRKRVSTDNVGLAKLPEGLELVRIGEPQRPEFAAWRYGDQFGRRRRRGVLLATGIGLVGVAGFAANMSSVFLGASGLLAGVGAVNGLAQWAWLGRNAIRNRKVVAEVDAADGGTSVVRGRFVQWARLIPSTLDQGWAIEVPSEKGDFKQRVVIEGEKARRLAAKLVPNLTPDGGDEKQVRAAVAQIEAKGDPDKYLNWLARNPKSVAHWAFPSHRDVVTREKPQKGTRIDTLGVQGLEAKLAVEMAVNEENERIALESELALLEEAWKDAEEVASIADRLMMPRDVDEKLANLKNRSDL